MNWIFGLVVLACIASCDDDDNTDNRMLETADKQFVEKTALSNLTEVDFGNVASTRGESEMVRNFGQHMISEHTTAQQELRTLADEYDDVDWPEQPDAAHQQLKQQLMTMSGRAFDSAYMASQVADHQMTLDIFENEISNGKDSDVRAYANKYMPHIQHHLERADSILNVLISQDDAN
jgi:putative membrane protein